MPTQTITKIEHDFAKAIRDIDIELLNDLLSEAGAYQIQDDKGENKDSNKESFIEWIINKRKAVVQLDYYFDQCLHCKIGNPVVLFNDGTFPRANKEDHERSKTGLMLNATDGKIDRVMFCYTFVERENQYNYEVFNGELKKYITTHNCDFGDAYYALRGERVRLSPDVMKEVTEKMRSS